MNPAYVYPSTKRNADQMNRSCMYSRKNTLLVPLTIIPLQNYDKSIADPFTPFLSVTGTPTSSSPNIIPLVSLA